MIADEAEAPLEADPQVEHDADRGHQQRERAVFGQFLADLRADELDAAHLGARVLRLEQRGRPSATASEVDWPFSTGRRISTSREEPKFCTSPLRPALSSVSRIASTLAASL